MADAFGTGGGVVSAVDHRLDQAGLIAPQTSSLAVRTGVMWGPGSTTLVTGTSATGTMTYSIGLHHWVSTRGTADGVYLGTKEAAATVNTTAAPGSNSRIDVIWSKQQDAGSTISPDGATAEQYGVTQGTAAVSPVKPTIPVGALELATAVVAAGATSTNGANVTISNTARQTVARGARIPVRDQAEQDALTAFKGLEVYRLDNGQVQLCTAAGPPATWATVYDPANASGPPRALLEGTGTQAVGTGTQSIVSLSVATRAVGMTVDGPGSRLVAVKAGPYLVSGMAAFAANNAGRRLVQVYKNGVGVPQTLHTSTPGTGTWRVPTATYQLDLAAGEYIQLTGLQESGATIDFIRSDCFLQATYVGAP